MSTSPQQLDTLDAITDQLERIDRKPVKRRRSRRPMRRTAEPEWGDTVWASFVPPSDSEWAAFLAAHPQFA